MNMKPKAPLPGAQPTVDLSKAETLKCEECNNYLFIQSYAIKRISSIMSPSGEEALAPILVYSCGSCGTVPKLFLEGSGLEEPKEESPSLSDNFLK
tara:strand:+ start:6555 stop:6842 length:288 start_codon:yes stop_codon:yes gene_type:complete